MDSAFNRITALRRRPSRVWLLRTDIARHYFTKGFDDTFDASVPWDDFGAVRLWKQVSAYAGLSSVTLVLNCVQLREAAGLARRFSLVGLSDRRSTTAIVIISRESEVASATVKRLLAV